MLIFVIAVVVIILPLLLGAVFAALSAQVEGAVAQTKFNLENKEKGFNPSMTLGHKITVKATKEEQLQEARIIAAKTAASLPRGANMRIGGETLSTSKTAGKGITNDPMTAVRIAGFHGWDGAKTGSPSVNAPAPTTAVRTASGGTGKRLPVANQDYALITITDGMTPEEKRKARIQNAKAKSQAFKAYKAASSGEGEAVSVVGETATASTAAVSAPVRRDTGIAEPNYIEITDSMAPDEVRKARIQNSKLKSEYNKALKAAGIDASALEAPVAETVMAASPEPATATAPLGNSGGVPKPDYIEITDGMSADDVRKARIQNSKLKSEYNKALKAAGIDPATVA